MDSPKMLMLILFFLHFLRGNLRNGVDGGEFSILGRARFLFPLQASL